MLIVIAVIVLGLVIIGLQLRTLHMVTNVSEFLVQMRAQVQRVATSEASVKTLLSALLGQVRALTDKLANEGVTPEQLAGFNDLLNTVTASADDLAADVTSVPAAEDTQAGAEGDDTVEGGTGDDSVAGTDTAADGDGAETLTGGTGDDTLGDAQVGDGSGEDTASSGS